MIPRALTVVAVAIALAGVSACAKSSEEPPPVERVHRHRGAVQVVIETTLEKAGPSEAQRAQIDAIRERLEADHEARAALREELRAAASDIVRAGTAESQQFDAALDRATEAVEKRAAIGIAAVQEIHAMLTPAQRSAVAEGLRERIDARWGKRQRKHHDGLKKLTAELMLEADQAEALREIRDEVLGQTRKLRPTALELHALVDAFETEGFAAALDAFHAEKAAVFRDELKSASANADAVLSLLYDDQRELLADLIEQGPEAIDAR